MSAVSAADNDTIYVNTTGNDTSGNGSADNPYLTIQKGVAVVNSNGTIYIANGTYQGTNNTNITINKNMTIIGESLLQTVINGENTNMIFYVNSGVTLNIQNLTISQVKTANGGAIYNLGNCTLTNCTFTGNYSITQRGTELCVIYTYVIPEGMEIVSIETEPGYPQATYNPATRTITWSLGTIFLVDPWIKLNVRVLNSGMFNVNPLVTTLTYDPTLGSDVQHITINAVQAASASSTVTSSGTIGMQETGLPINYLILAILAVISGFIVVPKRK